MEHILKQVVLILERLGCGQFEVGNVLVYKICKGHSVLVFSNGNVILAFNIARAVIGTGENILYAHKAVCNLCAARRTGVVASCGEAETG